MVKNLPAKAGDSRDQRGFHPGVRKIPGVESGDPLQYSRLENSMDREAWWATGEINPEYSLEGLLLKVQTLAT